MATELNHKQVAFLFTEGVEQVELVEPLQALIEAGADTTLVSLQTGEVQMFNHLDKGDTVEAEARRGRRGRLLVRCAGAARRRGQPRRAARRPRRGPVRPRLLRAAQACRA